MCTDWIMIHRLELFDFYYYCHILYINLFDFHADHDQINWSLTSLTTIILMMLIFVFGWCFDWCVYVFGWRFCTWWVIHEHTYIYYCRCAYQLATHLGMCMDITLLIGLLVFVFCWSCYDDLCQQVPSFCLMGFTPTNVYSNAVENLRHSLMCIIN